MAVSMYIAIIMNIQEKHGRAVKHCTFLTLNGIIIWVRCLSSLSSSIHVNARNVEAMYTTITMVVQEMHARHVKHYIFLMLHGLIIWARAFLPPGLPSSGIAHHGAQHSSFRLCRSHTQTRATAAAVGAARPFEEAAMEHGTVEDSSASTFSIAEEEHTLANPARFVLNQE
ncbi:hypothetical protein OsI_35558 [Oryza sativa Indica Group]|uniref:Uncharacterized protein n=1 Tax=Oryza sativa subsp. indica TaxID=39946 RepID=B8BJQ4_ORYSI|nr:hypothetical protein OsI_35558 [Oryza sativa Indica Group]